jgi:nucleotide-binding universal stress UspA family protein
VSPRALGEADAYLQQLAQSLRADGTRVEIHTLTVASVALAIDQAAQLFRADMIAFATHGDGPLGRILHGRTAWRALAHSPVPVLLRGPNGIGAGEYGHRKIMVPLDGSRFGEAALPLAETLAKEWGAEIWLVLAVETSPHLYHDVSISVPEVLTEELAEAREYLAQRAAEMAVKTQSHTLIAGQVAPALVQAARDIGITDVVMATHGRTGLARVIMGSVADGLVQRLHCPIIVVPASALAQDSDCQSERRKKAGVAAGTG